MLFIFALAYAIRRVQVSQDGLKLIGTHQLLVVVVIVVVVVVDDDDADDTLGGRVHTIQEKTEAVLVASNKIGLEVNADKTKYMVMSRNQNYGRSHRIKTDNISFERAEEFRCLGTKLINPAGARSGEYCVLLSVSPPEEQHEKRTFCRRGENPRTCDSGSAIDS
jgi:hypothetical protein